MGFGLIGRSELVALRAKSKPSISASAELKLSSFACSTAREEPATSRRLFADSKFHVEPPPFH